MPLLFKLGVTFAVLAILVLPLYMYCDFTEYSNTFARKYLKRSGCVLAVLLFLAVLSMMLALLKVLWIN